MIDDVPRVLEEFVFGAPFIQSQHPGLFKAFTIEKIPLTPVLRYPAGSDMEIDKCILFNAAGIDVKTVTSRKRRSGVDENIALSMFERAFVKEEATALPDKVPDFRPAEDLDPALGIEPGHPLVQREHTARHVTNRPDQMERIEMVCIDILKEYDGSVFHDCRPPNDSIRVAV